MSRPTGPQPPPEAAVIKRAREAQGISPEEAAERVPLRLGPTRWRQIEAGYERLKPFKPTRAPAKTLAHMALVVGVSPEQLDETDRQDAADVLREIMRQVRLEGPPSSADLHSRRQRLKTVPDWVGAEENRQRQRLHDDAVRRGLDKTGHIVGGLNIATREDELWDLMSDQRSPEYRYDMIIHMRDRDDAVARRYDADDSDLERGNGTER